MTTLFAGTGITDSNVRKRLWGAVSRLALRKQRFEVCIELQIGSRARCDRGRVRVAGLLLLGVLLGIALVAGELVLSLKLFNFADFPDAVRDRRIRLDVQADVQKGLRPFRCCVAVQACRLRDHLSLENVLQPRLALLHLAGSF